MKIKDAIANVVKSPDNERWVDFEDFTSLFFLTYYYVDEENHNFRSYWVSKWLCTDTNVGIWVTFLNDEPISISSQRCRKCDVQTEWVSKESYHKTKEEVRRLIDLFYPDDDDFRVVNPEEEIAPEWFKQKGY